MGLPDIETIPGKAIKKKKNEKKHAHARERERERKIFFNAHARIRHALANLWSILDHRSTPTA